MPIICGVFVEVAGVECDAAGGYARLVYDGVSEVARGAHLQGVGGSIGSRAPSEGDRLLNRSSANGRCEGDFFGRGDVVGAVAGLVFVAVAVECTHGVVISAHFFGGQIAVVRIVDAH